MMKTNKVTKLGVSLLSVAVLGVVAPVLTDESVFGISIVKAEETRPLEYRIVYYDKDTGEEIAPPKIGTINSGEIVNIYKDIDGYQVVSNYDEWMPGFNASYRIMSEYFGFSKGRLFMYLDYKKLDADAKPSETPKPEVKPEPKPSETPKPEVKPSEKPDAEAEEQQKKPLKYRVDYIGESGEKVAPSKFGVLNPGETVNIYKDIEGHEVVSRFEWLPGYNMDYDTLSTYSGFADGYNYMYLKYKKLNPAPTPTPEPEVKPEPKPSETPKPEVKPEPKPSDTSKPEVKPETKPSETPKPEVKPETKPSETPKPEVKPSEKPVAKPETSKPTTKPQTGSNNAPTAPINPVGQDSNTKADKPVSKTETTALPNTGEQNSILGFAGFLLASLGLAGLTYKGRH